MNLNEKIKKNKKIISYGISGIMTTLISFISFKVFLDWLKMQYVLAFSLSWILAVTFAFLSTRKKVYDSKAKNKKEISNEYIRFIIGRVITYVINLVLLMVAVEIFKFDEFYSNVVITIIVIILNYFVGDIMINKLKKENSK